MIAYLEEMATVAKPNTILAWHRAFAAQQGDRSQLHTSIGRPRNDKEIEDLVVRMARENGSWGYDRIVGALANLGYTLSDQSVGNILKHHGIPPAPERTKTTTWHEFIRFYLDVLLATDFFTRCQGDGGRSSTPQRSWDILSLCVHAQMTAEPDPKIEARCWSCGPPLPARSGMVPCDVDTDAVS